MPPRNTDPVNPPSTARPVRQGAWRPLLLLAAVVGLIVAASALDLGGRLAELRAWIVALGPLGPAVFVVVYALAATLAVPASLLTVAAGAMFGSLVGVATVIVGATLGASAAFAIARWFARDAVAAWLGGNARFRQLDELTARHGAIVVALTRLVPIFPFNLLNYGFGLTRVPFGTYLLWSFVCMLPGTVLYVVGADALTRAVAEGRVPWPLVGVFLVAVAGLLALVRWARGRLAAREAGATPEPRS